VLPRRGLAVLWGEPKSGKTFLILDMAYHIATGKKWRGLATKQGPVVYAAFEGQDGIYYRVHALKHYLNGGNEFPMAVCKERLVFSKRSGIHRVFLKAIEKKCHEVAPVMVVLDTLAQSIEGSENDPEHMGWYARAVYEMAERLRCLVVVVHHPNAEGYKPRGHTALTGTCDAQIKVGVKGKKRYWKVEYTKDGPTCDPQGFSLVTYDTGMDDEESGERIYTCVIEHTEVDKRIDDGAEGSKDFVKPQLRRIMDALEPLIRDEWASMDAWKDVVLRMEGLFRTRDMDSRARTFRNWTRELKDLRLLEEHGEMVRLLEPQDGK